MIAKRIAVYLDTLADYTLGEDLFLGFIPPEKEIGISLVDIGGLSNESGMGKYGLQIYSINDDYVTAMSKADSLYDLLCFSNGFTADGLYIFNCTPLSAPKFVTINSIGKVVISLSIVVITAT